MHPKDKNKLQWMLTCSAIIAMFMLLNMKEQNFSTSSIMGAVIVIVSMLIFNLAFYIFAKSADEINSEENEGESLPHHVEKDREVERAILSKQIIEARKDKDDLLNGRRPWREGDEVAPGVFIENGFPIVKK